MKNPPRMMGGIFKKVNQYCTKAILLKQNQRQKQLQQSTLMDELLYTYR